MIFIKKDRAATIVGVIEQNERVMCVVNGRQTPCDITELTATGGQDEINQAIITVNIKRYRYLNRERTKSQKEVEYFNDEMTKIATANSYTTKGQ